MDERYTYRGLSKVTSFTIHHVYSYREVPMFSLNLLKIGPQCERVPRESDIVIAGWEWT